MLRRNIDKPFKTTRFLGLRLTRAATYWGGDLVEPYKRRFGRLELLLRPVSDFHLLKINHNIGKQFVLMTVGEQLQT